MLILVAAVCLISAGVCSAYPHSACARGLLAAKEVPAAGANTATTTAYDVPDELKDKVHDDTVKALATLQIQGKDGQRIVKTVDHVIHDLQSSMLKLYWSQPGPWFNQMGMVVAAPNKQIYSGHFPEPRFKWIVKDVEHVAELLKLYEQGITSLYIPERKSEVVEALSDEIDSSMSNLATSAAQMQGAVAAGSDIDVEALTVTLYNIRNTIESIDLTLKTVFQIVNLKDDDPALARTLMDMRLFEINANSLKTAVKALNDNVSRLAPLPGVMYDATILGWSNFKRIQGKLKDQPFLPADVSLVNKRLAQIGEYIDSANKNLKELKLPGNAPPAVAGSVNDLSSLLADINTRYSSLKSQVSGNSVNQVGMIEECQGITKDLQQIEKVHTQVVHGIVDNNAIL